MTTITHLKSVHGRLAIAKVYSTALPCMASPSPTLVGYSQPSGARTKDGLTTTRGKSYGTVKDATPNVSSFYRSVVNHSVVEEDTLQGLAVKYDVTVSI